MKKVILALAIAFVSVLSFSACTEEEVAPTTQNGGGAFSDIVGR